eukprot:TRINITY_DN9656_c0_g1_i1.p1 TRINITY_DN9656_c0_g1~~TRINITY_DN9656_c0_g1_i1.p1  ORF type:complete len:1052 (+),score=217.10 TRINITY_DN9656_c0_g1_i1:96-3251(+)
MPQPAARTLLAEQVLCLVNALRADPAAFAVRVEEALRWVDGSFYFKPGADARRLHDGPPVFYEAAAALRATPPLPPLAPMAALHQAAQQQAEDVACGAPGSTGLDGSTPQERLELYGAVSPPCLEVVASGVLDANELVLGLLIDDGVPGRVNRAALLDGRCTVCGVGGVPQADGVASCVIDLAGGFAECAAPSTPTALPPVRPSAVQSPPSARSVAPAAPAASITPQRSGIGLVWDGASQHFVTAPPANDAEVQRRVGRVLDEPARRPQAQPQVASPGQPDTGGVAAMQRGILAKITALEQRDSQRTRMKLATAQPPAAPPSVTAEDVALRVHELKEAASMRHQQQTGKPSVSLAATPSAPKSLAVGARGRIQALRESPLYNGVVGTVVGRGPGGVVEIVADACPKHTLRVRGDNVEVMGDAGGMPLRPAWVIDLVEGEGGDDAGPQEQALHNTCTLPAGTAKHFDEPGGEPSGYCRRTGLESAFSTVEPTLPSSSVPHSHAETPVAAPRGLGTATPAPGSPTGSGPVLCDDEYEHTIAPCLAPATPARPVPSLSPSRRACTRPGGAPRRELPHRTDHTVTAADEVLLPVPSGYPAQGVSGMMRSTSDTADRWTQEQRTFLPPSPAMHRLGNAEAGEARCDAALLAPPRDVEKRMPSGMEEAFPQVPGSMIEAHDTAARCPPAQEALQPTPFPPGAARPPTFLERRYGPHEEVVLTIPTHCERMQLHTGEGPYADLEGVYNLVKPERGFKVYRQAGGSGWMYESSVNVWTLTDDAEHIQTDKGFLASKKAHAGLPPSAVPAGEWHALSHEDGWQTAPAVRAYSLPAAYVHNAAGHAVLAQFAIRNSDAFLSGHYAVTVLQEPTAANHHTTLLTVRVGAGETVPFVNGYIAESTPIDCTVETDPLSVTVPAPPRTRRVNKEAAVDAGGSQAQQAKVDELYPNEAAAEGSKRMWEALSGSAAGAATTQSPAAQHPSTPNHMVQVSLSRTPAGRQEEAKEEAAVEAQTALLQDLIRDELHSAEETKMQWRTLGAAGSSQQRPAVPVPPRPCQQY